MRSTARVAALAFAFLFAVPANAFAGCDELWAAAMADDVAAIARLINRGEKVNCRDPLTAETPLMAAAQNGHIDAVKLLLLMGADAKTKNAKGDTALDMARANEAAFATIPDFAKTAQKLRQVIAVLAPLATDPNKPVTPVTIVPTDLDAVARMKLEGAKAALMARQYDAARQAVLEVWRMAVPEQRRAQAFTVGCDISMRTKDWSLAKTLCEKALSFASVSEDDRAFATETLKALRKQKPELFK